jgi:hypothetical protein
MLIMEPIRSPLLMSTRFLFARLSASLLFIAGVASGPEARAGSLPPLPQQSSAYEVANRTLTFEDGGVVHLSAAKDDGIAWLVGQDFTEGRISIEVRGVDVMQRSFVGVAFHGGGRHDFDVVYTRPFNFNATDAQRRAHSLQYLSLPDNPWEVLREKFPGKYESALTSPPAAESWVRLTLEINARHLSVFVDDGSAPALVVDLLNDRLKGRVGLWVGNNSEGWFRNLTIQPKGRARRDDRSQVSFLERSCCNLSADASTARFVGRRRAHHL